MDRTSGGTNEGGQTRGGNKKPDCLSARRLGGGQKAKGSLKAQLKLAVSTPSSGRAGEQLVSNRAIGRLGQRFRGVRRDITVTPAGIYAAAHRRGAKAVAEYFDWLEKNNFDSRKGIPGNKNLEKTFRQIETRLREFEDLQLWSGD